MATEQLKRVLTLRNLIFVFALIQYVWLIWYFYTGYGGSQELTAYVMSLALTLQILFMDRVLLVVRATPRGAQALMGLLASGNP